METLDLYEKYIGEREGLSLIRTEFGFLTCRMIDNTVFINDLFVDGDHRNSNEFFVLAKTCEAWGKARGAVKMRGVVWINTLIANDSLRAVLSYGLKVVATEKNVIVLEKEI